MSASAPALTPRWELQLWLPAVLLASGKPSTAKGKEEFLISRYPLDAPIETHNKWGPTRLEPWLTPKVFFTGDAYTHDHDYGCVLSLVENEHREVYRGGQMEVRLVQTSDSTLLAKWVSPEFTLKTKEAIQMSGVQVRVQLYKDYVGLNAKLSFGIEFLEHEAMKPIVQLMRQEYKAKQLEHFATLVTQKRASLKRIHEELEEVEQAEKRMRESAP